MKIIPFRGAEKFLGQPVGTSAPTIKSTEVKNELVQDSAAGNTPISFTTEKKLVKIGVDPNTRSTAKQDIDHVSIHEQLNAGVIPSESNEEVVEKANKVYSLEEVKLVYESYLKELENMNAVSSAALSNVVFQPHQENRFELHFQSQPQIDYFIEERAAMFGYFREHNVVGVELIPKLAEMHSEVREFLTDRQRFEKMMAQNPKVEELWRRFKLVID